MQTYTLTVCAELYTIRKALHLGAVRRPSGHGTMYSNLLVPTRTYSTKFSAPSYQLILAHNTMQKPYEAIKQTNISNTIQNTIHILQCTIHTSTIHTSIHTIQNKIYNTINTKNLHHNRIQILYSYSVK